MSRRLTIDQHAEAKARIASDAAAADSKARLWETITSPAMDHPPAMRKEADVNRVLSILDDLERGARE